MCGTCEFSTDGVNELQCPKQLISGVTVPGESPNLRRKLVTEKE